MNKKEYSHHVVPSSNSGVALIMVLGLLTIMVLMAVTFAITMRTERLAAGNAADTVRARELTHVALARALDDLRALYHMPDRFVVDTANNKIVLLGPGYDYEAGDEVRIFSVGTLPGGLNDNITYTVASKGPDRYTITLSTIPVDAGVCKAGVNIYDTCTAGFLSSNISYVAGTPVKYDSDLRYAVPYPYDDTRIKLATSYSNAVQGNAVDLSGNHTLELMPIHGIYPVVTIVYVDGDQLVYTASRQRLRTGMAVRIEGIQTIYYIRNVKNQFDSPILGKMNWFIQLCSTYADALKNQPISTAAAIGNLIIPIPSASPHSPAFASYGTNTTVSLSDFSELVTFDSGYVIVTNRYRAGAAVAFTTTGTLPSLLNPKTAYYAVPGAVGTIQLAETLDEALAAVPTTITFSGGSGTHRIYKLGLSGEATNYFPMAVYTNAAEALASATSNGFFEIRTTNADLMGKVRYVIVDCSGLLDANYVGDVAGGVTRTYGNDPREFPLGNLPDLNASTIPSARTTRIRFETLLDLYQYVRPFNTFIYSYSLPEQYDTNMMSLHTPLNIGGEMATLTNKYSAITNGLCMAGFTLYQAGVVYSNLIDYVDDDYVPSNFEYCVESVPMINEVVASCQVNVQPDGLNKKYTVNYSVNIEYWYPFVTPADQDFILKSSVVFTEANNIRPNTPFVPSDDSINAPSPGDCVALPHPAPVVTTPAMAAQFRMDLISTISASITTSGGDPVDQLINPVTLTNILTWTSDGLTTQSVADAECLDPRFNFDPNNKDLWVKNGSSSGTLNSKNSCTLTCLLPANDNDNDSDMYVGNRKLGSVGELGYLVYSTNHPWKTVKLYGPDRHRVLDVFVIAKDVNDRFAHNIYNRGQINPNTRSLDVLKAWFKGMPVDKYQGESGAPTLDDGQAQMVAQNIVNEAGSYTNLSEIGRAFKDTTVAYFPVPPTGASELERESYFRNTCGLFNVHQSVFTILLEAKVASGGNIPRNPARQRAVAIVWRDPYTGEMFVRHLKWLGD